tara:strand:+ start:2730 stop:3020 length:291 start_codon:yes stop_codon:yes gene_type:complete
MNKKNKKISDVRVELTSPSRKGWCFTKKLIRLFSIGGSNPRPSAHKTDALPTELTERKIWLSPFLFVFIFSIFYLFFLFFSFLFVFLNFLIFLFFI